jgi:phage-related protein
MADRIYWIDVNGVEYPLTSGANIRVLSGMKGRFMPPISITKREVPFQHGSRKETIKVKDRDVDIPVYIKAKSEIELRDIMRRTLRMINPLKGDGKLKSIAADGSQRELICCYTGGLEGDESKDTKGYWWQKALLIFNADDPFWCDATTIVQTFGINENPGLFFPILPLRLTSSTVFADMSISNDGDVETWPEWIITGPGENIVLRNMTTSEVMSLDHPDAKLEVGESIVINTNPRPPNEKTVTKSDGTNLFYTLSDDSSLWALQDGDNSIQLEMTNATSESSIQLTYRNRYWGP